MGLLRWVLFGLVLRRFKWLGMGLAALGLLRRVTDGRSQNTNR